MSYNTPAQYASVQPTMGLPEELIGTELKSFAARSNIRSSPSVSGSAVGPSSSMLFTIANDQSFIKPNSMYLRCKVTVTGGIGAGAGYYMFSGQSALTAPGITATGHGVGGASSLIQRCTVTLPGGVSLTYNNWSHMQNAVIKPHCLSSLYVSNDLRQLEHANTIRNFTVYDDASRSMWVSIPLNIPIFNASASFPLCLCSAPLSIEINTNTVNDAYYVVANGSITGFAIDNACLVYETISPSAEFISALKQAKQSVPYSLAVNDWMGMASGVSGSGVSRLQFGLGLASLKSVVYTFQTQPTSTSSKLYQSGGMVRWTGYVDGVQVTPPNLDSSDFVYLEAQRALQRVNDSNIDSFFTSTAPVASTSGRNNYESAFFLAGVSVAILDSSNLSQVGIPAGTLVIEAELAATQDLAKWQATNAAAAANVYVFCMFDSVISIDAMGNCTLRR